MSDPRVRGSLMLGLVCGAGLVPALADPVVELGAISVTATRSQTSLDRVPAAVQVLDRDTIERHDASRLGDVLPLAQGVHLQRRGTNKTVSIRGFSNEQTLILIDGRRVAAEPSQRYELSRIPLADVERVEIVRGPGSTLYGADALGGVINVITRDPTAPRLDWRARCTGYELDDGSRCEGDVYGVITPLPGLGVSLSGTTIDQGEVALDDGETQIERERFNRFALGLDWRLAPDWRLVADLAHLQSDSAYSTLAGKGGLQRTDEDDTRTDLALALEYDDGERDGRLRVYRSELDKDRELSDESSGRLIDFDEVEMVRTVVEGQFGWRPWDDHHLTLGAEYRQEAFEGNTIDSGEGVYEVERDGILTLGSESTIDYSAFYLQDQWQVSSRLELVLGGRYDASDQFDDRATGSLGAVYRLFDGGDRGLRLRAQLGQGYRVPTVRDLYVDVTKPKFTRLGNPDLEPEQSTSLDLGIEGHWGAWQASLGVFRNWVDDLIDVRTIDRRADGKPIYQYANIGTALLQGVETALDWRPSADLGVGLQYSYLDANDTEADTRLQDRPRHRLVATLDYDYRPWDLGVSLVGDYSLGVLDSVSGREKGTGVWNLDLSRPLVAGLDLRLGVDNLFDVRDDDLLLVGRAVYLGVEGRF
ncbi:TonB-dependent siderophore receptor [Marichromatium sp. AB31]|uniref:TonB-dependent receptor plug domain-containing protein n=1 Tax=Marichromatium sp. AB31 TaxID=2483362 RepID=UPI000F3CB0A2|nr:TonB-dependent receptor [Marichromatium sp. AB31]RNE88656.1 TonB-dependent receptor [Marichromatium sp. AB31]